LVKENAWKGTLSLRLALLAILTALTTVLTMVISIPIPATQGYINLGDVGVFLSGLILGPFGGIAGGVGSALADYALGYINYVPITFIVKGLQGTISGIIFGVWKPFKRFEMRMLLALLVGSVVMVLGYFIAETVIYGVAAAVLEVPGNIFQVTFGSIVSAIAFLSITRVLGIKANHGISSSYTRWLSPTAMIVGLKAPI